MSKTSTARIMDLTDGNYEEWATQVHAWVHTQSFDAWTEHVELREGFVPPVYNRAQPNATALEYWNLNSRIGGTIILTLSATQKQHLANSKPNPAAIWSTLESVHRRKGFGQYLVDFNKLLNCRYVDGTSMQAHLLAHTELRKKIAAAGCWYRDDYYCGIFLRTLPDSWDSVVQILSTLQSPTHQKLSPKHEDCVRCNELSECGLPESFNRKQTIDWKTVSYHVLGEEARRVQKAQESNDKGTALAAFASNYTAAQRSAALVHPHSAARNNNPRTHTIGSTCSHCRSRNHEHTQCWKLNGYPPSHKLYNPHFVKPGASATVAAAAAAAATATDNSHAEGTPSFGWTAVLVDEHLIDTDVALLASSTTNGSHQWIVDSGASAHFCNDHTLFDTLTPTTRQVNVAAGKSVPVLGTGSIALCIPQPDGSVQNMRLSDVLYVPEFLGNLLSVKRLVALGTMPVFDVTGCNLVAPDGTVKARALLSPAGLYKLLPHSTCNATLRPSLLSLLSPQPTQSTGTLASVTPTCMPSSDCSKVAWRLPLTAARQLQHSRPLLPPPRTAKHVCAASSRVKRSPEVSTAQRAATCPLALVHADLCGPFSTASRGNARVSVRHRRRLHASSYGCARSASKDAALDAFQYYRTHAETVSLRRRTQAASHAQ